MALITFSAGAQEAAEEHEDEVFTIGGLTVADPWTRAATAGAETLVFFETMNEGPADTLTGATTAAAASVEIVGLTLAGAVIGTTVIGQIEIPVGEFELDPGGLALALRGLTTNLEEGAEIEITLTFAALGELPIHVLVGPADGMLHPHGH
jgi:copper(I)-binding protein